MNAVFELRIPAHARPTIAARLIVAVMRVTGLGLDDLRLPDRTAMVSAVRTALAWLLVEVAQMPYAEIGRLLERDHTTIMHAHRVALENRARGVILAIIEDELR